MDVQKNIFCHMMAVTTLEAVDYSFSQWLYSGCAIGTELYELSVKDAKAVNMVCGAIVEEQIDLVAL